MATTEKDPFAGQENRTRQPLTSEMEAFRQHWLRSQSQMHPVQTIPPEPTMADAQETRGPASSPAQQPAQQMDTGSKSIRSVPAGAGTAESAPTASASSPGTAGPGARVTSSVSAATRVEAPPPPTGLDEHMQDADASVNTLSCARALPLAFAIEARLQELKRAQREEIDQAHQRHVEAAKVAEEQVTVLENLARDARAKADSLNAEVADLEAKVREVRARASEEELRAVQHQAEAQKAHERAQQQIQQAAREVAELKGRHKQVLAEISLLLDFDD